MKRPVFVLQATGDNASVNIVRELKEILEFEEVAAPVLDAELPPLGPQVSLQEGWERARLPTGRDVLLFTVEGLHIHAEGIGEHLSALADREPEAVIVASRHRAASGKPSFTVHPVGNFGKAEHGGKPGRLTPAHAALQTALLRGLARRVEQFRKLVGFEVTFEATHHGPLTNVPLVFAELGSSEETWDLPEGGRCVALAIMDALLREFPHGPVVFGVGGGHYAPRFTSLALERHCLVGHMLASHHWQDEEGLERCLGTLIDALPRGAALTFDRKSLKGGELRRAEAAAEAAGRRVYRSGDLPSRSRKTDG